MAAMTPEGPSEAPPPAPPGAPEAQRQARYNHLVGRLRSRQITMEEATELFALMQAMLRASEAARRAVSVVTPRAGGAPSPPPAAGAPAPSPAASPAADDLFLVGLLAMGAGAGLLAAMSRRLAEGAPPRNDAAKGPNERRGA